LKQSEWVLYHEKKEKGGIKCNVPLWTMEELLQSYVDIQVNRQTEKDKNSDDVKGTLHCRQKEVPLFPFIVIIPMLHDLLGLGNDLIDHFWKSWFDKRVDKYMTLLILYYAVCEIMMLYFNLHNHRPVSTQIAQ